MMKKALVITALLFTSLAFAEEESPTMHWEVQKGMITNKTLVSVIVSDYPEKDCNKESINRGYGGFKPIAKDRRMMGCSFWKRQEDKSYTCTIILGITTNNDILGHEMRHCLQGAFH